MSNQITINGTLVPEALAELKREVDAKAARASNLAITPFNATKYEDVRKENRQFIKECLADIESVKAKVLEPFSKAEAAILATLEPLEVANKDLASRILIAKKEAFRQKVKAKLFDPFYGDPDDFGEIVPFQEVYDPTWYGKTETAVAHLLRQSVDRYKTGRNLVTATVRVEVARNWEVDEFEKWLLANKVAYTIERKEIA